MILADTSVWVDHLRVGEPRLADARAQKTFGLIELGQVLDRTLVERLVEHAARIDRERRRDAAIAAHHGSTALPDAIERLGVDRAEPAPVRQALNSRVGQLGQALGAAGAVAGRQAWKGQLEKTNPADPA
jgi:hypothetical protein